VQSALTTVKASGQVSPSTPRPIGPAGSHLPATPKDFSRSARPLETTPAPEFTSPTAANFDAVEWSSVQRNGVELRQSFSVPFARADVWRFFADLDQLTRCMPGARLTKPAANGRAEGDVNVKLGSIVSAFQGTLDVTRDDNNFRGVVRGAGRDSKSPSSARAIITYDVRALEAAKSQVDVSVKFLLSGALAQFSRSGLVKDVADHLTLVFAQNLEARLSGRPVAAAAADTLDVGTLARSAVWTRIRGLVRKLFGG